MWTLFVVVITLVGQPRGGYEVSVDKFPYMHTQEACTEAGVVIVTAAKKNPQYVDSYTVCLKDQ